MLIGSRLLNRAQKAKAPKGILNLKLKNSNMCNEGRRIVTITVFTKPHCPQCDATKRQFTKLGVNFETVDLTQSPSILDQLREAGFRQAPVVITPDSSWSGYRPDLIAQIADKLENCNQESEKIQEA